MIAKKKMGKRISIEVIGHEGFNPTCAGKAFRDDVVASGSGFNPTCAGKDFLTSRDTGWLPEIHSLSLMG